MMEHVVNPERTAALAERLEAWIREKVRESGRSGGVVGLSGGIDSATVAVLAARALGPQAVLGVLMPCHSAPEDQEHALLAAQHAGVATVTVDLTPVFDALVAALGGRPEEEPLAVANLKPRLRMATLYFFAARRNALVLGTGNRSELEVGYFTKYGDGGVDLLPLGGLLKTEVRELAAYLGVPEAIRRRKPTAGLWQGQTDEGELGLSYELLDAYLRGEPVPDDVRVRVEELRRGSAHKRAPAPIFVPET